MPGLPRKADGMFLLAMTAALLASAAALVPGLGRAAEEPGKSSARAVHPGPVEDAASPPIGQAVRPRRRPAIVLAVRARRSEAGTRGRGGLPAWLVRRQSGVLRRVDRPPGSGREHRRLSAISERRGDAPAGLSPQRDGGDPRRAGSARRGPEARPTRPREDSPSSAIRRAGTSRPRSRPWLPIPIRAYPYPAP